MQGAHIQAALLSALQIMLNSNGQKHPFLLASAAVQDEAGCVPAAQQGLDVDSVMGSHSTQGEHSFPQGTVKFALLFKLTVI